jgi:hypothetical protein
MTLLQQEAKRDEWKNHEHRRNQLQAIDCPEHLGIIINVEGRRREQPKAEHPIAM